MLLAVFLFSTESCSMGQAVNGKVGEMLKIGPELKTLYEEYSTHVAAHEGTEFQPSSHLVRVNDGRVVIDAVSAGNANSLKFDLESLGMQQAVAFGRIVSGELPIASIPAMETLASLNYAKAALALPHGDPR
jgi:hypothetical protein